MKPKKKGSDMKAVITVIGKDSIGIISRVSSACAEYGANIVDISQSVMREYFAMIMLVELDGLKVDFAQFSEKLAAMGQAAGLDIRIMHEDIFNSMHRI